MTARCIYAYVTLILVIQWCNGNRNESSALPKCQFAKYLTFNTSQATLCEEKVNEFITEYEKCEEAIDLELKDVSWSLQRNYTERVKKESNKFSELYQPMRVELFKADKKLWSICGRSNGSRLKAETERMLKIASSGYMILDKKENKLSRQLMDNISNIYNFGKVCRRKNTDCYRIEPDLSDWIITERNYTNLLWIYEQYRAELIPKIKPIWIRNRKLKNKWAKKYDLESASENWVAHYEMSLDKYEEKLQNVLDEIKPLYQKMHAYLRHKLGDFYGEDKVNQSAPIPAHLTGNLWNQKFSIPDIVKPYPKLPSIDITNALQKTFGNNVSALLKHCVDFYYDLGFEKLSDSFWENSEIEEPKSPWKADCHGSAHSLTNEDLRLSMCGKVNTDTYLTMIHEMGHIFYYFYYRHQRYTYRDGANPGFHEAIGDTFQFLALGMPELIKQGWVDSSVAQNKDTLQKWEISNLIQVACDELMFVPSGVLFDRYLIHYDEGKIPKNTLNKHWWEMTQELQGITTPDYKERGEQLFDVASKYHIANSLENYSRYALAKIYKFQFLKSLCEDQFKRGIPLHNCNISGNKTATLRFRQMLKMGASKSWPDAMLKATGQSKLSAQPLRDYFGPLETWLDEYIKNNSITIGW